jgi:hypothetical protein
MRSASVRPPPRTRTRVPPALSTPSAACDAARSATISPAGALSASAARRSATACRAAGFPFTVHALVSFLARTAVSPESDSTTVSTAELAKGGSRNASRASGAARCRRISAAAPQSTSTTAKRITSRRSCFALT